MRISQIASGFGLAIGLGATVALTGCGAMPGTGSTSAPMNAAINGQIMGGRQPISGSQVYLFAAGNSGYGVNGASLLSAGSVTTASDGSFSITGDYTCPVADPYVYIVALNGNAGSGTNNAIALAAALGKCTDLQSTPFVIVNEATTVVSFYALQQFVGPNASGVGTSATNPTGLANAFQAVPSLIDISTGVVRTSTNAGNGTVPQAQINTLANILASCVNSAPVAPATTSTACASLFADTTPPGGGTVPANILEAVSNIVLYPGNNVTALYNLSPGTGPFQPTLGSAPNDWSIGISYTGGGLNNSDGLAIDGSGNIWVTNSGNNSLSEFSPVGAAISPAGGITGNGLDSPSAVAVDGSGNVWVADQLNGLNSGNSVSEFTPAGGVVGTFSTSNIVSPDAIVIDGAGDVFVGNSNTTITKLSPAGAYMSKLSGGGLSNIDGIAIDTASDVFAISYDVNILSKFNSSGVAVSSTGYSGAGMNSPDGIAIDHSGNLWLANHGAATVSELSSTGVPISGSPFTAPDVTTGVAIDGNNTVWTSNHDGSISHFNNSGSPISSATGYKASGANVGSGIALDPSGNIWVTDRSNTLSEYLGAGAPTVAPLQKAVTNGTMGTKP